MKHKLLFFMLPVVLILGWCFGTSEQAPTNTDTSLTWSITMDTTKTLEECKAAVTTYLDAQKNVTLDASQQVKAGNTITVDYIGRLADGTVFDTSIESVAKWCDVYNAWRDYITGLEFIAGWKQVVAGFDEGVIDMKLNETKTIEIPAEKAYGAETVVYPHDMFSAKPDGSDYVAGESFLTAQGQIDIVSVSDEGIEIKNLHPLGGKDLIFDVTLKAIK